MELRVTLTLERQLRYSRIAKSSLNITLLIVGET